MSTQKRKDTSPPGKTSGRCGSGETSQGPKASEPTYKPTADERAALDRYLKARDKAAPNVKIMESGGSIEIGVHHPDRSFGFSRLMEAVGTSDDAFFDGLLLQLVNAGKGVDEKRLNFMLSVIKGIEPRDQIESMLAAQMAAVHMAMMDMTRRLAHANTLPQQDSAERALNKLARTFAGQVEALKRYRTGGQQKVTVEHVTVNEGGQAIVGNVQTTPSGRKRKQKPEGETTPQLSDQSGTAFEMDAVAPKQVAPVRRGNPNGRKPPAKH